MDIRSFFGSTKSSKDAPISSASSNTASAAPASSPVKRSSGAATQVKSPMKSPVKATAKVNVSPVPINNTSGSKKKRTDEFDADAINLNDTDEEDAPTKTTQSRKRLKSGKEKEDAVTASITSPARESLSVKEPGSATKKRATPSATIEPVKKQKLIDLDEDEDDGVSAQTSSAVGKGKKSTTNSAVPPPPSAAPKVEGLHFDDMKIAVSGTFQTTSREDIEEYIKERGGKISTAISGKTNFLVVGHILEDGREVTEGSKYRTAKEKKIPILTEEEFFNKYPRIPIRSQSTTAAAAPAASMAVMNALNNEGKIRTMSSSKAPPSSQSYTPGMYDLWVDKYRPTNPQDLVGHGDLVRRLSDWLRTWEGVHITKKLPKPPFTKENPGAKAVLISGPPGIGKTTVANIIAKQFQYEVLELNASDTRNKRELDEKLVEAVSSHAISSAFASSNNHSSSANSSASQAMKLQRRLVIMDEVDGMGGSDRGGVAELIKIIKISRVPIICICNDRQSPKVKSLANHCYDLRVRRPMKAQIADRLVAIAAQEGLIVDKNAAEILVEQAGNDIRAALNALQMWAQATTKSQEPNGNRLGYTELKAGMSRIEKDKVLRLSPFDAALGLMAGEKAPFDERYNAFFVDYSLIPLLVQENYVDAAKSGIFRNPQLDDASKMEALCHAAEAASDMDLVGTSIRGADQHWELLPTQAIFCMRVGQPIVGFQAFPAFPSWLGKYSATGKKARLTREMVQHSSLSIGQGFVPIRLDYVPYLRNRLLQPLLSRNKDGCEETIQLLDEYGLTKDDFTESMREMQFILEKASTPAEATLKDKFEKLDTQTKSTLTRLYNAGSHTSMTIVQPIGLKGAKGKKKSSSSLNEDGLEEWNEDEEAAAEEEPEEEEDVDALRAQLSKAASKGAKSSARASAAGGGRGKAAGGAAATKKKK